MPFQNPCQHFLHGARLPRQIRKTRFQQAGVAYMTEAQRVLTLCRAGSDHRLRAQAAQPERERPRGPLHECSGRLHRGHKVVHVAGGPQWTLRTPLVASPRLGLSRIGTKSGSTCESAVRPEGVCVFGTKRQSSCTVRCSGRYLNGGQSLPSSKHLPRIEVSNLTTCR